MENYQAYWELFDDQSSADFSFISYINLEGETVFDPIDRNLSEQVASIRRKNGKDTEIKVYK